MEKEAVSDYLHHFIKETHPMIETIRSQARTDGVPIMQPISMATMLHYIKLLRPKKLLEIGTAVGYSSIKMAMVDKELQIVTIERDEKMYHSAKKNIERLGLDHQITVIHNDALLSFEQVSHYGPFDMIFIDAAKAQYMKFFELYEPLLKKNGVVITDNILFRGLVAQNIEEIETKRIRRLVEKIQDYNIWLMNQPTFDTVILPIEDGLAISIKLNN